MVLGWFAIRPGELDHLETSFATKRPNTFKAAKVSEVITAFETVLEFEQPPAVRSQDHRGFM